ncbi:hypothetical protein LMIY3S_02411 [Labrys miyagiensis]
MTMTWLLKASMRVPHDEEAPRHGARSFVSRFLGLVPANIRGGNHG